MGDGPGVLYNPQGKLVQGWCDPDRSFVLPKRVHVDCSWKRLPMGEPVPEVVNRLYQPRNVLERHPWWYKTPPWKQGTEGVLSAGKRRPAPKLGSSVSKASLVPSTAPSTPAHRVAPTRASDLKRSASAPHELARAGVPLQVVQGRLVVVENFVGRRKPPSVKSPSKSAGALHAATATPTAATTTTSTTAPATAPATAAAPAAAPASGGLPAAEQGGAQSTAS
jgi:hypothetical protein